MRDNKKAATDVATIDDGRTDQTCEPNLSSIQYITKQTARQELMSPQRPITVKKTTYVDAAVSGKNKAMCLVKNATEYDDQHSLYLEKDKFNNICGALDMDLVEQTKCHSIGGVSDAQAQSCEEY